MSREKSCYSWQLNYYRTFRNIFDDDLPLKVRKYLGSDAPLISLPPNWPR